MNANYVGSFAEQNMLFRSSVDVVETLSNEPFHCLSIYIPSNLAPAVIKGFEDDVIALTEKKPLVYSCDVQNYKDIMTGELLTQYQAVFRDDSNVDVVIYLIVFYCDGTNTGWELTSTTIEYAPLTAAFEKLYHISFLKVLFDPNMNGQPAEVPSLGTKGNFRFTVTNNSKTTRVEGTVGGIIENDTAADIVLPAGTYSSDNHYSIVIGEDVTVPAHGSVTFGTGSVDDVDITISTTATFAGTFPLSLPLTQPVLTTLAAANASTWGALDFTFTVIESTGQAAGNPAAAKVAAGTYIFTNEDGVLYNVVLASDINLPSVGSIPSPVITGIAQAVGNLADDVTLVAGGFSPAFGEMASVPGAVDLTFNLADFVAGTDAGLNVSVASKYFDLALALAYMAKLNPALSLFFLQVRIQLFIDAFPNVDLAAGEKLTDYDTNKCWCRSASEAEEVAGIPNLRLASAATRARFLWGALKLMGASNTFMLVHSEPNDLNGTAVNIISELLAEWFRRKNDSGLYVGNKLHNIRLTGDRIKPLGWPSMLNSAVNENDAEAASVLQAKGIAYLQTISDSSLEDCRLTYARTTDGVSINAKMIAKWVDYRSAMDCANMITDKGTLTDPVLTDSEAYIRIQSIVGTNLAKFSGTKRLFNIQLTFPSFATAKVGLTALQAASAWTALYVDDLDKVTVSGGITEM